MDIKRGVQVATVKKTSEGVVVALNNGEVLPPADVLLWAVGRSPNTEGLGCKEINMSLDTQGNIVVDDFQNTNIAGVYALGDVAGKVSLNKRIRPIFTHIGPILYYYPSPIKPA